MSKSSVFENKASPDFDLGIGYEVQSWSGWRGIGRIERIATLGLGGLVLRVGLGF